MRNCPIWAPSSVYHGGHSFSFDCIAGTGEPIYIRTSAKGEVSLVILVGCTRENPVS